MTKLRPFLVWDFDCLRDPDYGPTEIRATDHQAAAQSLADSLARDVASDAGLFLVLGGKDLRVFKFVIETKATVTVEQRYD